MEGYTGADIEAVVREAGLIALREDINSNQVKKSHFEEALKKVKPSVTKATLEAYKKIEEAFLKSVKSAVSYSNTYLG